MKAQIKTVSRADSSFLYICIYKLFNVVFCSSLETGTPLWKRCVRKIVLTVRNHQLLNLGRYRALLYLYMYSFCVFLCHVAITGTVKTRFDICLECWFSHYQNCVVIITNTWNLDYPLLLKKRTHSRLLTNLKQW